MGSPCLSFDSLAVTRMAVEFGVRITIDTEKIKLMNSSYIHGKIQLQNFLLLFVTHHGETSHMSADIKIELVCFARALKSS